MYALVIAALVIVGLVFLPPVILYDSANPMVEVASMVFEESTGSSPGAITIDHVTVGSEFWMIYASQQHGIIQTIEQLNVSYLHISLKVAINILTPSGSSISLVGTVEGPARSTTQTAAFGPNEGLNFSGLYTASISLVTDTGTVLSSAQTTFSV
jgi:hypothetical protein